MHKLFAVLAIASIATLVACGGPEDETLGSLTQAIGCTDGVCPEDPTCHNGDCPPDPVCTDGGCDDLPGGNATKHCCCVDFEDSRLCCCKKTNDVTCRLSYENHFYLQTSLEMGKNGGCAPHWWPEEAKGAWWPKGAGCGFFSEIHHCGPVIPGAY